MEQGHCIGLDRDDRRDGRGHSVEPDRPAEASRTRRLPAAGRRGRCACTDRGGSRSGGDRADRAGDGQGGCREGAGAEQAVPAMPHLRERRRQQDRPESVRRHGREHRRRAGLPVLAGAACP